VFTHTLRYVGTIDCRPDGNAIVVSLELEDPNSTTGFSTETLTMTPDGPDKLMTVKRSQAYVIPSPDPDPNWKPEMIAVTWTRVSP
jgi:hypothetical protein